MGAAQAEIAVWGLIGPRSFFNSFPGAGHRWVVELGTYNEHLVRDYAASELGFAVLLVAAAIYFERRLVLEKQSETGTARNGPSENDSRRR